MAIAGAVTRDDQSRSGRITVAAHETERLVPENLNLALAGGRAVFERSRVEVAPGERVQIVVEQWFGQERPVSRDGGSVAAGRRTTPPRDTMMFRPPRPYLRSARCAPGRAIPRRPNASTTRLSPPRSSGSDLAICCSHSIARSGGTRIYPSGTAAPGLRAPRAAPAPLGYPGRRAQLLDEDQRRSMLAIFEHELADTAVVSIGRSRLPTAFTTARCTSGGRGGRDSCAPSPPPTSTRPRALARQHDCADEKLPRPGRYAMGT